jgi:DNA-binding SARP family transcriptional activator
MLQIRMLGKFEALLDGQPIAWLWPQLRRLLARLCLEGCRTIEYGRLLRDLWPESESGDVVRKSLQRLRSLL